MVVCVLAKSIAYAFFLSALKCDATATHSWPTLPVCSFPRRPTSPVLTVSLRVLSKR
ncbi:hypothetical protein D3C71_2095250 [compost metagenome]